jgi:hypothetical protein
MIFAEHSGGPEAKFAAADDPEVFHGGLPKRSIFKNRRLPF